MSDAKKVLSKSFVDNHESVNEDTASALVVQAEQKIREIQEELKADEKLVAARQIAKDISKAYSSAISYEKAKISFLLDKIADIQGGNVNPTGNS